MVSIFLKLRLVSPFYYYALIKYLKFHLIVLHQTLAHGAGVLTPACTGFVVKLVVCSTFGLRAPTRTGSRQHLQLYLSTYLSYLLLYPGADLET